MKLLVTLILVLGLGNFGDGLPIRALLSSQSDCPTILVEAPKDIDGSGLVFTVKISGGNQWSESLTYKWKFYGGEIKAGQGTPSVTITNFDLRKKSVTVVVEIDKLPLNLQTEIGSFIRKCRSAGLAIENDRVTKRKALTARQRLVQQIVGPERGWPLSQVVLLNRGLDLVAAPGQLRRSADSLIDG